MRRAIAAAALGVGVALVLPVSGASAQDKSYHFPRVEIDATVNPDGSLTLVERRTFDFRGDFSFAFFTIEPQHAPPIYIRNFTVREGSRELQTDIGTELGGFKATWFFEAHDEIKTFRISYKVLCAVDVYDDAAHLNWQFIGEGWTEVTDVARVTVHLPQKAAGPVERQPSCEPLPGGKPPRYEKTPLTEGEVKAWGHGPLAGVVRIPAPDTVVLSLRELAPATFVEGSILFPRDAVPLAPEIPGGPGRQRILADERRLAEEANALRARHERETGYVKVLLGAIPGILLLLVLLSRVRDRFPGVPKLLQEPPESIHPVKLAVIWSAYRKRLDPKNAYRTQFLHLAHTGTLGISAIGRVTDPEDFQLRERAPTDDALDARFMAFLLPEDGGEPVSLKEVDAKGARKQALKDWWTAVSAGTRPTVKQISRGKNRLERWLIRGVGVGGALYGFDRWTAFADDFAPNGIVGPFAATLIPVSILGWFAAAALLRPRPRSPKLRERLARWKAFRRFLKEFPSLEEAPALAVVIWERYLVDAAALGVADEVEKQVRALVPEEELPAPWPDAPSGVGSHLWVSHALHQSAYAPASAATSVGWSSGWGGSSSGGGGGGGFSGGGGGGGGGTGGGAG